MAVRDSPPKRSRTYEVFINFHGEDSRDNFVNHLYAGLDRAGIHTFKDDMDELQSFISPDRMKALQDSTVAVVVFSKNYAKSSLHLDELVKIIECRNLLGQKVLTVLYKIVPSYMSSEIRGLYDSKSIYDMESVNRWREAAGTARRLAGWSVYPGRYLKDIIGEILNCVQSYRTETVIQMLLPEVTSSSSTSSTVVPTRRWSYDVFLSFRGEDTRNNFVDHLYSALDQAGIYTFKDDEKLRRGKFISLELPNAIQQSMVAVVVFSNSYANSSWCLDELVEIIKCRDLTGQRVLPVFYNLDPSDVREQKNSFHSAFEQQRMKLIDDPRRVERWRKALVTAANLSGWDVSKTANGHEAVCIKKIVETISRYNESRPTEDMIGMGSQVRYVKSLVGESSDDSVCIIGIWGMGGIGKTTLARAVYHQISYEFEGSCFLEDVRENGCDKKGLKSLQEKLLSEILMEKHFKVKDCRMEYVRFEED